MGATSHIWIEKLTMSATTKRFSYQTSRICIETLAMSAATPAEQGPVIHCSTEVPLLL